MSWQPAHKAHAIERVSITFVFESELPSKQMDRLLNAVAAIAPSQGMTTISEDHELDLTAAAQPIAGMNFAPSQSVPIGKTFQSVINGQTREAAAIHNKQFSYISTNYIRWADFRQRVDNIVGSVLSTALESAYLDSLKIEYWDRFVFSGDIDKCRYGELLKESKYSPGFIGGQEGLFHSHVGFFADSGKSLRRLVNLNLDAVDLRGTSGRTYRSVGIYTMVQDSFTHEGAPVNAAAALSTSDVMHDILKGILVDVISSTMADRISLKQ